MAHSISLLAYVPDEIWLQVFISYREEETSSNSPKLPPPFLISSVCKAWQGIALANPVLWDTISIKLGDCTISADGYNACQKRLEARVSLMKLWIERAGSRPLSISVSIPFQPMWDEDCFEGGSEMAMQIPRLIVEHAAQIQALEMPMLEDWAPLFWGVKWPMLRKLGRGSLWLMEIDLNHAPRLAEIKCPWVFRLSEEDYGRLAYVKLPWAQITDATIDQVYQMDVQSILDLMPNLRRCQLELGVDEVEAEDFALTLVDSAGNPLRRSTPALNDLALNEWTSWLIVSLLEAIPLTLQALKVGDLEPVDDDSIHHYHSVTTSIIPHSHSLTNLTLHWDELTDWKPVADLLPQLPSLMVVELRSQLPALTNFDDTFLQSCFATPKILPQLRTLKVHFQTVPSSPFTEGGILNVLRHRSTLSSKFSFHCRWEVKRGPVKWLSQKARTEIRKMMGSGVNVGIYLKDGQAPEGNLLWEE